MSRIGKQPIPVPSGVEVKIDGSTVTVKGPKGELDADVQRRHDASSWRTARSSVARPDDAREHRSLHGLTRTLVANMVTGVSRRASRRTWRSWASATVPR